MRKLSNLGVIFAIVLAAFTSCKKDDVNKPDHGNGNDAYDFQPILRSYVEKTIIPTYGAMKDNSKKLFAQVETFKTSGAQADLDKACELWKETRKPWEASEAFLFGPAAYHNLDPLLDSWPLDKDQLDQVLAGSQVLDAAYVADGLGAVLRGFHTVEYLLFREGQPRKVADVTAREKEYLVAVTEVLRNDCVKLWAAWEGGKGEEQILEDIEFEVGTPYGQEFIKAGEAGSRYNSQTDAIDDIIQGMLDIADEVGNAKIADPHGSNNVLDVESWFSWNSLTDFKNNVHSIKNSYIGGYYTDGGDANSLSAYVKSKDEALDTEIKTKIDEAIAAIGAIPEPFRNNLQHANIQPAMDKLNELAESLEKIRKVAGIQGE